VDGRIILNCILKEQFEAVDWIYLAQDRVQWWSAVNIMQSKVQNVLTKSQYNKEYNILWKSGEVKMFGNETNKPNCMQKTFGADSTWRMPGTIQSRIFCLPVTSLKTKIKIYRTTDFFCCFVWVWSLVSHIKGRTQFEGVWG